MIADMALEKRQVNLKTRHPNKVKSQTVNHKYCHWTYYYKNAASYYYRQLPGDCVQCTQLHIYVHTSKKT
ncbi:unnamed protein product [Allacma fusca]|uniref:Uncharacterized protein n=1 Tax=Allacma fusca TaxID=39272 RepID=A0A8J2LKY8_9HEXA|nr:unnamed protein product [Allacma fusca]